MDKDEYRAYRETVIRRQRQEEDRKKAAETRPYDPRKMNVEKMPFGCWVLVGIVVLLILGFAGVVKIFH